MRLSSAGRGAPPPPTTPGTGSLSQRAEDRRRPSRRPTRGPNRPGALRVRPGARPWRCRHGGRRRRTGRPARARPSPGGRRDRARPGCRDDAGGRPGRPARASGARAVSRAARHAATVSRAAVSSCASGPEGSETARSWFGRTAASSPSGPSTTSRSPPPSRLTKRRGTTLARARAPVPAVSAAEPSGDLERLDPERVHLDRLADPRRHRRAVDARVHPGERPALLALPQEAVGGSTPMPKRVPRGGGPRSPRAQGRAPRRGRRRRRPRRAARERARTKGCRRPCCTRVSRCRPCSRASLPRPSPPRDGAPLDPPRGDRSRGRAPRTTSSGRGTTRRTTGSRRPRSGPSCSITNRSAASTSCFSGSPFAFAVRRALPPGAWRRARSPSPRAPGR